MQSMFRLPWCNESPGDKIMEKSTLHKSRPLPVDMPHFMNNMNKIKRKRTDSPEPVAKKDRLILKARGLEDFRIQVRPETTFEQLADAFRTSRNIAKTQPVTLMFDGERLSPMDTVQDTELEDMDALDVLLK